MGGKRNEMGKKKMKWVGKMSDMRDKRGMK